MIPNISIRLGSLNDLPDLRALWKAYVEEQQIAYPVGVVASIDTFTRQAAMALAAQPPTVTVFFAYQGSAPIGFLLYEAQSRIFGDPSRFAFIHYLYVAPSARHHGIASMLATLAGEHMLAENFSHCEITTTPSDTQWHSLGFTPYELRAFAPVASALGAMLERQRQMAAARGNGLDHSVTPAPADPPPINAEEPSED
jgi:ribosomal protein S18 acetylase RimI-like enzyme